VPSGTKRVAFMSYYVRRLRVLAMRLVMRSSQSSDPYGLSSLKNSLTSLVF
jgi:hypothetical protein